MEDALARSPLSEAGQPRPVEPDAGSTSSAAAMPNQVIRLVIGADHCCVDIMAVPEANSAPRTNHLVRQPDAGRSVLNSRGAVVPIIEYTERLQSRPLDRSFGS
jgi:chemotaxis signal transduction protein